MTFETSERHLFTAEDHLREASRVSCDALLAALQREHPAIVRGLQKRAADKAIWCSYCEAHIPAVGVLSCLRRDCATKAKLAPEQRRYRR